MDTKWAWEFPDYFSDKSICTSRHKERKRFRETSNDNMLLSTVGIGQDFVINDPSGRLEEWARRVVESAGSLA